MSISGFNATTKFHYEETTSQLKTFSEKLIAHVLCKCSSVAVIL